MRLLRHPGNALWLMGGFLALTSCGSGDNDAGDGFGSGNGNVTDTWRSFCTATFTKDTAIVDPFDEPMFTARAGDEFLLADYSDTFDSRAELMYLTGAGPDSFEVEPSVDGAWPFTSNCTIGQGVPYYAVFKSISVFAEKELTTKMCDLSEGSVLPAGSSARGYSFTGSLGESALYELILGPFSAQCQGQGTGFVKVPQTRSFGATTWLVPVAGIIGPE
jgi:hypothetical protein